MKKTAETITARQRRAKRRYFTAVLTLALCAAMTCPAFAANGDPLTIVNNLSDFIFSIIKAVGVIVLGWASSRWVCPSSPTMPASAPRVSCVCSAA